MTKIQKDLNFTCPGCQAIYRLVEIHQAHPTPCSHNCLGNWKQLLHTHFQDQIILHLAQTEAQNDPDNDPDNDQ